MYDYYYDIPKFSSGSFDSVTAGILGVAIVVLVGIILFIMAIGIVVYVFESLSWYTIAKKRNIENPWLAWIPYANGFLIGKIGDYYYNREIGKNYHFSIWIVCLLAGSTIAPITIVLIFLIPFALIAASVLEYVCVYKFYKNVAPDNAVLLLVMSIIFPIAMPFILFAHRNKPDVIPANYQQPVQSAQPAYNNTVPPYQYQQPVQQAPVQPPQTPEQSAQQNTFNNGNQ